MKQLLLALFLTLASPVMAQPPTIIEQANRSAVRVFAGTEVKVESLCTGIVVGIVRVLTADHCIAPNHTRITVDDYPAKVVKRGDGFILLDVPTDLPKAIIKIASSNPKVGDPVTTIGYVTDNLKLSLKRNVAGYEDSDHIILDGPIIRGMSGGPVINEKGEVVGMNEATNQHVGLVRVGKELRDFLK